MVEPEKREYFRVGVRLPIEFRTISYDEYLDLENVIRCSTTQIADSINEVNFLRDLVAHDEVTQKKKGQIYAYVRTIDKKLDIILDLLTKSKDERIYTNRHIDVNIGGAGIRFVSDVNLNAGMYVELKVILPILPYPKITALCQVTRGRRITKADGTTNWEAALKFLTINENDRDLLIKYIFARERESLRNKKKGSG
jgi:c-di-GMP-binding flagellar brake protein YcgR